MTCRLCWPTPRVPVQLGPGQLKETVPLATFDTAITLEPSTRVAWPLGCATPAGAVGLITAVKVMGWLATAVSVLAFSDKEAGILVMIWAIAGASVGW